MIEGVGIGWVGGGGLEGCAPRGASPPLRASPWDSLNGKYGGHGTVDRDAPSSFISESLFAE